MRFERRGDWKGQDIEFRKINDLRVRVACMNCIMPNNLDVSISVGGKLILRSSDLKKTDSDAMEGMG